MLRLQYWLAVRKHLPLITFTIFAVELEHEELGEFQELQMTAVRLKSLAHLSTVGVWQYKLVPPQQFIVNLTKRGQ